jgi:hypothetical protein
MINLKTMIMYMDLIQTAATIALLTLLMYFVMVNIMDHSESLETTGDIAPVIKATEVTEATEATEAEEATEAPIALSDIPKAVVGMITNQLDLDTNKEIPPHLVDVPLRTDMGVHTRTTVGGPAEEGGENLTTLSVYNEQAKGVLPVNHDLFEKPADFGSDVTNINQFYRNNPEIFERSMTSAPNAADWHTQGKEMYNKLASEAPKARIEPWNFEKDPLGN